MVRATLLVSALLLTACERRDASPPPEPALVQPALTVNLAEKLGGEVEVTSVRQLVFGSGPVI